MIDKLTVAVRQDMSLPEEAADEADIHVADVTTSSADAYRHYLEGLDFTEKYYSEEAEAAFRRAIEYDSTFAMAYYQLSTLTVGQEKRDFADRAIRYSEKASTVERYYIEAYAAFLERDYEETIRRGRRILRLEPDNKLTLFTVAIIYGTFLGEPESTIYYCRRVLEIDPGHKNAYNQLAYAYHRLEKPDSSIWAINQYIALAPDEANPYDTRGDLYAWNGRLDEALASYKRAEQMKPGFVTSTIKIGAMFVFMRQYDRADSCFKVVASSRDKWDRAEARTYLATIPIYQGKFARAQEVLRDGMGADQMEGTVRVQCAHKHRLASEIYRELGEKAPSIQEARLYRDIVLEAIPENPSYVFGYYGHVLAAAGEVDLAEELLREAESRPDAQTLKQYESYYIFKGLIARADGDLDGAIANFEMALDKAPYPYLHIRSVLAETYLEAGRHDLAVSLMEKALLRYDLSRLLSTVRAVKTYYLLGMAYEASGWNEKAIEQYETFLEIWTDADPGIEAVKDARARLEGLRAAS
jgi:tetratricopeptide (TPR) repeat protein